MTCYFDKNFDEDFNLRTIQGEPVKYSFSLDNVAFSSNNNNKISPIIILIIICSSFPPLLFLLIMIGIIKLSLKKNVKWAKTQNYFASIINNKVQKIYNVDKIESYELVNDCLYFKYEGKRIPIGKSKDSVKMTKIFDNLNYF